ncbi:metal ABC transporter permease [Klebsiella electrica]|uniref:metal ABC transporter permease n=1 Tax=Klebsiella electrica TaxID=1259973 RepID=UPI00387EBC07
MALLLTRHFIRALLLAVAIAVSCSLGGVWLSFYLDSAPAPTIVVLFTALFIITFVWRSVRDNRTTAHSGEAPGRG